MPGLSGMKGHPLRTHLTAPVATAGPHPRTDQGGRGVLCDPASEVTMLAMTIMVGEDTYYERADMRDARFVDLVHAVTPSDPAFIDGADVRSGKVGLAQYLRESMLMRSTPWPTSPR